MNKRKVLLILIISIVIIGLFFGGYFIFKRFNNHINEETNQTQVNENNLDVDLINNDDSNASNDTLDSSDSIDNNENSDITENASEEKKTTINDNNASVSNDKKEENKSQDIPSKLELKSLGNLQYYLYTPSNPVNNMPLIMYLHGGTNKRSNVESLLTTDGFPKYLYDGYYGNLRAYVVIPKLTNNYTGWVDIADNLKNLIKNISTNYSVDMNKVSLTGHSMGGTGTYQVQIKLSNTFACIAPMSGSVKNTEENLNALSKTKVWAFVGTNDTIVDPSSTRTIISALKSMGAPATITEFNGIDHFGVPSLGYKNSEFINWLVSCHK